MVPPRDGGSFGTRYFMPWQTHPTQAVTGGQCMATCGLTPGTVADGIWNRTNASPAALQIEHPTGKLEISVEFENPADGFDVISSGLVRTARKIVEGDLFLGPGPA